MEIKKVLIGGGLLVTGYCVGKAVGYVKCIRDTFDIFEKEFPGTKNYVAKKASDRVIDHIFKDKYEKEEGA